MHTAYIVVTVVMIVATAGMGVAGLAKADFVLSNADEVGAPRSWVPVLATLKSAGAAGLVLGLIGVHAIGLAAAAALVAFFIGAITAHVRAKVFYNIAFPGAFLAVATASLALAVNH